MSRSLSESEKAEKRAGLVRLATAILEAEGADALTLRRLAAEAGISRSTPYLYFPDKAALLDAVRVAGLRRLTALCCGAMSMVAACGAAPGTEGWLSKMRVMGQAYLEFGLGNPELYRLIFESGTDADAMSADYQAAVEDYRQAADAPLQRGYEAGLLTMPAERLGPALWAATHGLLMLRRAGNFPDDESFHRIWADLSQVLAKGFFTTEPLG